jgi:D-methionine transport system ATP-binding protein
MVKIEHVSKSYSLHDKENLSALQDVSLEIKDNAIFGIIGLSGAGKSTLLRTIIGLEKIDSGQIFIDNVEVTGLKDKDLRLFRRNIGVVFQGFNLLYQRNVEKNIALPLELAGWDQEAIKKRVVYLLQVTGLEGKEKAYPLQLSGGQKQRVAIARALALNPKLLLLDEITSALDPRTTNQILRLLLEVREKFNVTMLFITHEIAVVAAICDEVAVLDYGKIVETGKSKDVLENPRSMVTRMLLGKGGL